MSYCLTDIVKQWEIPRSWQEDIIRIIHEKDFRQKASFLAGSPTLLADEKIWQIFGSFSVIRDNNARHDDNASPRKRILISSFSGCELESVIEQAHEYLQQTLVHGFLDIIYPEWGDTPWDLLQLMLALVTPSGEFSEKLLRHNRWPLRGAYTRRIKHICDALSKLSCNVMITGPSGIGKEAIARLIHARSSAKGNFISVSVPTIPKELFSGVLFGYEKGAYTGAEKEHLGSFELAHNGTLFLDEIGDIEPKQQAALLRVLSERQGTSIGGTRSYPITCRVIAATNKTIRSDSGFRSDLRIRLAEQELACANDESDWQPLKPLSLVREQIPLLFAIQYVRSFHEQVGFDVRVKSFVFSDVAERCTENEIFHKLSSLNWTMNFRELAYISLHSLLRFLVLKNADIASVSNQVLQIIVKIESRYDSCCNADCDDNLSIKRVLDKVPAGVKKWSFLSDYIHRKAIEYLRDEFGYTDAECARELDVDRSSLSRFLKNKS